MQEKQTWEQVLATMDQATVWGLTLEQYETLIAEAVTVAHEDISGGGTWILTTLEDGSSKFVMPGLASYAASRLTAEHSLLRSWRENNEYASFLPVGGILKTSSLGAIAVITSYTALMGWLLLKGADLLDE